MKLRDTISLLLGLFLLFTGLFGGYAEAQMSGTFHLDASGWTLVGIGGGLLLITISQHFWETRRPTNRRRSNWTCG